MRFEFFIARRYLRARRRQTAVSVITGIAITGLALGVAALIIAQALITGFRRDLQEKILQGTAHLNLLRADNRQIDDYQSLTRRLLGVKGVRAAAATIYAPVLIGNGGEGEQAIIKGVDPEAPPEASEVFATVISGDPRDLGRTVEGESPGVILGRELARVLGLGIGDEVTVVSAQSRLTPLGVQHRPRYSDLRVIGLFASGLYEYDAKWGYVALGTAREMVGGTGANVIQMKVSDLDAVEMTAARVREAAGESYTTTTWQELNRPLFAALSLQHRVIVIFFALLIMIAALNIITALTMMVMEKNRDIAILRAQGATPASIRLIFLSQGAIIGVVGTGLGLGLGLLLCALVNRFDLISLPAEIYAVSGITLDPRLADSVWIVLLTLSICLAATVYPSRAASRLTPVEGLRYE
ncbi:MAG: ABC transporter permease [Acidobacteria bacterium]|nr:ABC transporter permease [Acidobacteriota bacterium]